MIKDIYNFFENHGSTIGCVSSYVVGSYANNSYDALSDLDLVIIGNSSNSYTEIKKIGNKIHDFFINKLQVDSIFYCEPSQELLCFLDPSNINKVRVHLIYHPLKRFKQYIENKDQVLVSWKSNYKKIYGDDLLSSEMLSKEKVDPELLFSNTVNLIIQNLHNSYLLADIHANYSYFLKLYKLIIKRLREIDSTQKFKKVCSANNYELSYEFRCLSNFLNRPDSIKLKQRLLLLEGILLELEKEI